MAKPLEELKGGNAGFRKESIDETRDKNADSHALLLQ
jgi:hypothetical protein